MVSPRMRNFLNSTTAGQDSVEVPIKFREMFSQSLQELKDDDASVLILVKGSKIMSHAYKDRSNGRGFYTDPASRRNEAKLFCTQCNFTGKMPMKSLMPPDQIDKKFVQRGWELDPNICPTCVEIARKARLTARKNRMEGTETDDNVVDITIATEIEEVGKPTLKLALTRGAPTPKPVHEAAEALFKPKVPEAASEPRNAAVPRPQPEPQPIPAPAPTPKVESNTMATTNATVLEQADAATRLKTRRMHALLREHFNIDAGRYVGDWTDAKIGHECGLLPAVIANERSLGYGDLKEPTEVSAIRAEIAGLHEMADEVHNAIIAVERRLADFVKSQGFEA